MEIKMHLNKEIYEIVCSGTKNVEARVYDNKRRQIKIGDIIKFISRETNDESIYILARITNLVVFKNFDEMGDAYDMERLYLKSYTKDMWKNLLSKFYTEEEVDEYGVVAIEFELIK